MLLGISWWGWLGLWAVGLTCFVAGWFVSAALAVAKRADEQTARDEDAMLRGANYEILYRNVKVSCSSVHDIYDVENRPWNVERNMDTGAIWVIPSLER